LKLDDDDSKQIFVPSTPSRVIERTSTMEIKEDVQPMDPESDIESNAGTDTIIIHL
jgi:hypothetical protein